MFGKYGYNPEKLTKGSNKTCICSCDYCGEAIEKKYFKWIKSRKHVEKDSCNSQECRLKKQRENNVVKYGVIHHSQTESYKNKFKKTCLERYGVENPFSSKKIQDKIIETNLNKYGVENIASLDEIKDKRKQTMLERYGVEHPYQNKDILKKVHDSNLKNFGTKHYARTEKFKKDFKGKFLLSFEDVNKVCQLKNCKPLFTESEYEGCRNVYKFHCLIHNVEFSTQVHYLSHPIKNQCPQCKLNGTSLYEQEILNFIKNASSELEVVNGDRKTLSGKELDIIIPEKKIAVEFHGLYWHCELYRDKKYHQEKFQKCKDNGIELLQIYEDEWRDSSDIWKSIIKNKLKLCRNKIFARELKVIESDAENKELFSTFFDKNHLQGNVRYNKAFGLVDDSGDIFFAISLRRPFTKNKEGVIEVARVATKCNLVVVAGFSRLMKYIKEIMILVILMLSGCSMIARISENEHFVEQVTWELNALAYADLILMYFDPRTKSPITLLELGCFSKDG